MGFQEKIRRRAWLHLASVLLCAVTTPIAESAPRKSSSSTSHSHGVIGHSESHSHRQSYATYTSSSSSFQKMMARGETQMNVEKHNKSAIFLMGNKGSGQTALAQTIVSDYNLQVQETYEEEDEQVVSSTSSYAPQYLVNQENSMAFYNIPSFQEKRSVESETAHAYFMQRVTKHVKKAKFLFTTTHSSVQQNVGLEDSYAEFDSLATNAVRLMTPAKSSQFSNSVGLVITNVVDDDSSDEQILTGARSFLKGYKQRLDLQLKTSNKKDKVVIQRKIGFVNGLLRKPNGDNGGSLTCVWFLRGPIESYENPEGSSPGGNQPGRPSRPGSGRPTTSRPENTKRPGGNKPGKTSRPGTTTSSPDDDYDETTTRRSSRPGTTGRTTSRPGNTGRTTSRPANTGRPGGNKPGKTSRPGTTAQPEDSDYEEETTQKIPENVLHARRNITDLYMNRIQYSSVRHSDFTIPLSKKSITTIQSTYMPQVSTVMKNYTSTAVQTTVNSYYTNFFQTAFISKQSNLHSALDNLNNAFQNVIQSGIVSLTEDLQSIFTHPLESSPHVFHPDVVTQFSDYLKVSFPAPYLSSMNIMTNWLTFFQDSTNTSHDGPTITETAVMDTFNQIHSFRDRISRELCNTHCGGEGNPGSAGLPFHLR